MADELTRANTQAAFQAIRDMDVLTRETRTMLDTMNAAIASLNSRMTQIETVINTLRIEKLGTGPTEK